MVAFMFDLVTEFLFARSTYLPRWLGWVFIADGSAWVIDQPTEYAAPSASLSFLNVFFAGELMLMVWLLGWGWRSTEPDIVQAKSLIVERSDSLRFNR